MARCAEGIRTAEDPVQPLETGVSQARRHWFERACDEGGLARMMDGLAAEAAAPKTVMVDATYLKALRRASSAAV